MITDAKTLYNKIQRVLEDEGVLMTDEADEKFADACDMLFGPPAAAGRFGSGDPLDHWQCYSGTPGNQKMEELFQKVKGELEAGTLTRLQLPERLSAGMEPLAIYGACDTEPMWEMVDQLNPVLDALGYKAISYGEF